MNTKAIYFKVGLFVIITVVIIFVTVIIFGVGTLFREEFIVEIYFDSSIQGLDVGAPLKYRGVQIGTVKEINLVQKVYNVPSNLVLVRASIFPERVRVHFTNMKEFKKKFPSVMKREIELGIRARLASVGLTGVAFIEVDYLDPKKFPPLKITWKPKYPYVPSAPSSTFTQITESLSRITRKIKELELERLVDNAREVLRTITEKVKSVDTKRINDNVLGLLSDASGTNRRLKQILDKPEIDDIIADLKTTSDNAKKLTVSLKDKAPEAVAEIRKTIRRIDALVSSEQYDIEMVIENLKLISRNIKELTEDVKRYPSEIFFGKPPAPSQPGGEE